jgi:hypothetical protein
MLDSAGSAMEKTGNNKQYSEPENVSAFQIFGMTAH